MTRALSLGYLRFLEFQRLETENRRQALELEEARQLQLSMLPAKVPVHPDFEIAWHMETATEVGGDYYDYALADDGRLTLTLGDATRTQNESRRRRNRDQEPLSHPLR